MNRWRRIRVFAIVLAITVTSSRAWAQESPGSQTGTTPPPVVIEVSRDSFDWQDAGVGAAASLALVAIGFGLSVIARGRPGLDGPDRKGAGR